MVLGESQIRFLVMLIFVVNCKFCHLDNNLVMLTYLYCHVSILRSALFGFTFIALFGISTHPQTIIRKDQREHYISYSYVIRKQCLSVYLSIFLGLYLSVDVVLTMVLLILTSNGQYVQWNPNVYGTLSKSYGTSFASCP